MTKTQREILATMKALMSAGNGRWEYVPGNYATTIRITREIRTPDYHRGEGFGRWPDETYQRHLFFTLAAKGVIIGDATAPWMGRRDREAGYWLARLILDADDPFAVVDKWAVLVAERKAARS